MPHKYHVTVQPIDSAGHASAGDALAFEVSNHDNLFDILARMRGRHVLPEDEVAPFIIGLKLFTGVLIRHRRDALFEELGEAMGRFMKRLKDQGPGQPEAPGPRAGMSAIPAIDTQDASG